MNAFSSNTNHKNYKNKPLNSFFALKPQNVILTSLNLAHLAYHKGLLVYLLTTAQPLQHLTQRSISTLLYVLIRAFPHCREVSRMFTYYISRSEDRITDFLLRFRFVTLTSVVNRNLIMLPAFCFCNRLSDSERSS